MPIKPAVHSASRIEAHPAVLKVLFMQAGTQPPHESAATLERHVRKHSASRNKGRTYFDQPETRDEASCFFVPRVYCTVGAFDSLAYYLSPTLYLPSLTDELASAGQDVHRCILPALATSYRDEHGVAKDINERFIDRQRVIKAQAKTRAEGLGTEAERQEEEAKAQRAGPSERFCCITKLKLNPSVSWLDRDSQPDDALDRHADLLDQVALEIDAFLAEIRPRALSVCLGLDLGWNELLLLGSYSRPHELIALMNRLRKMMCERSFAPVAGGSDRTRAHLMATSITSIGMDWRLREQAAQHIPEDAVEPELLAKIAQSAAPEPVQEHVASVDHQLYLRPAYQVYPGHEGRVMRLLRDAFAPIQSPSWDGPLQSLHHRHRPDARRAVEHEGQRGAPDEPTVEIGRQDVRAPAIRIDAHRPEVAFLFAALLHDWLRRGRKGDDLDVRHIFDSVTRLGTDAQMEDGFPSNHCVEDPRGFLAERTAVAQELGDELVKSFKASLRALQVPYALSEQVMNLVSTFSWSQHHEILWEDSVWFAPAILQLKNYLHEAANRRKEELRVLECQKCSDGRVDEEAFTRQLLGIQERQRRLLAELRDVVDALRMNFNTRHLNSYELDHEADISIVYRGSAQQLLAVAQMILDVVARALLGSRATIATIGSFQEPRVHSRCGVTIVELGIGTANVPLLLEWMVHEVMHVLVERSEEPHLSRREAQLLFAELSGLNQRWKEIADERFEMRWAETESERAATRARRDRELGMVRSRVSECLSDLAELRLWRTERVGLSADAERWVAYTDWCASFLLRIALVAQPRDARHICDSGYRDDPVSWMPRADERLIYSAIERCLFVLAADEIAHQRDEDLEWSKLEQLLMDQAARLREHLLSSCILGATKEVNKRIADEDLWRKVANCVFRQVQDWWLEKGSIHQLRSVLTSLAGLIERPEAADRDVVDAFVGSIRSAFRSSARADLQCRGIKPLRGARHVGRDPGGDAVQQEDLD